MNRIIRLPSIGKLSVFRNGREPCGLLRPWLDLPTVAFLRKFEPRRIFACSFLGISVRTADRHSCL